MTVSALPPPMLPADGNKENNACTNSRYMNAITAKKQSQAKPRQMSLHQSDDDVTYL